MIQSFCDGQELQEKKFFSHGVGNFCSFEQITASSGIADVYCGCWAKR
jgi:hypothetical protein